MEIDPYRFLPQIDCSPPPLPKKPISLTPRIGGIKKTYSAQEKGELSSVFQKKHVSHIEISKNDPAELESLGRLFSQIKLTSQQPVNKALKTFKNNIPNIENKLGYTFENKKLLIQAFTHSSFQSEHPYSVDDNNQRLEFLGDAILGATVANYLFNHYPTLREGELTKMRSSAVDNDACAAYIQQLEVEEYLLLGRGEKEFSHLGIKSRNADLFEAITGAIYCDGGGQAAEEFLLHRLTITFHKAASQAVSDPKSTLQDYSQRNYREHPHYQIVQEKGPDHNKIFMATVTINNNILGFGKGHSKKQAEKNAAEKALLSINSVEFE